MDEVRMLFHKVKSSTGVYDIDKIQSAYSFAVDFYQDMTLLNGMPYISLPVSVAIIAIDLELDTTAVVAALLYEMLLYEPVLEEIRQRFGEDVACLIRRFDKLSRTMHKTLHIYLQTALDDRRIVTLKLADRLYVIRLEYYFTPRQFNRLLAETIAIYIPLARRLGFEAVEEEMKTFYLRFVPDM